MFKKFRKFLKNQKGLALVELLAVVVILGIIAAIVVPSVGGIIQNSKKDAHVSNAQQMISAAQLAYASNDTTVFDPDNATSPDLTATLDELFDAGYIDAIPENPYGSHASYNTTDSLVTVDTTVTDKSKFKVTLKSNGVDAYISDLTSNELDREDIAGE